MHVSAFVRRIKDLTYATPRSGFKFSQLEMSKSSLYLLFLPLTLHRGCPCRAPRHLQGGAQREDGALAHEQYRLVLPRGRTDEVSVPHSAVEGRLVIGIGQLVYVASS